MRLRLRCALAVAKARRSPVTDRPVVALEWTALGQPELGPLLSYFTIDHEVGTFLLHQAARALGLETTELVGLSDTEEWVKRLLTKAEATVVVVEVEIRRADGHEYLNVRQVLAVTQ